MGFGLITLVMHEFFHFAALQALGGDGYITFSTQEGFTHFTTTPSHVWAVKLSGGLLTAIFFLSVFWVWAWSSDTPNDTNLEVAAFTWGIGNLAYAPVELLTSSPEVGVAAFGIGFSAAAAVYVVKLSNWMATDSGRPAWAERSEPLSIPAVAPFSSVSLEMEQAGYAIARNANPMLADC